jgi:hypothetical protein
MVVIFRVTFLSEEGVEGVWKCHRFQRYNPPFWAASHRYFDSARILKDWSQTKLLLCSGPNLWPGIIDCLSYLHNS